MKKKFGFTLAEVLITLGIIGVVAALAAPALNSAVQKNKVGPSLRKFVSTMNSANEHLMADNEIDQLSTVISNEDTDKYLEELVKYVKGSKETKKLSEFDIKNYKGEESTLDYTVYTFANGDALAIDFTIANNEKAGTSYKGIVADVLYDINGFGTGPNRIGKDIFRFDMDDNGSIIPMYGQQEYQAYGTSADYEYEWRDGEDKCNKTEVTSGNACAGSIADNDWKVIYKY